MAVPGKKHTEMDAEALRQARELAESIDAAAADLAANGPVSGAELARALADLEAEWAKAEPTSDASRR